MKRLKKIQRSKQTIKNLDKKIDNLITMLSAICSSDSTLSSKVQTIQNEFRCIDGDDKYISEKNIQLLYKIIHATRAFDSGLRAILDAHHISIVKGVDTPGIGCYIQKLSQPQTGLRQLSGTSKKYIQDNIANNRNFYVHVAGRYPNDTITRKMITDICKYYEEILMLKV